MSIIETYYKYRESGAETKNAMRNLKEIILHSELLLKKFEGIGTLQNGQRLLQ